jgi:hypothetical protein
MPVKPPITGAHRSFVKLPLAVLMLWLMAAVALPVWVMHDSSAWDVRIYGSAMHSLLAGHDPYSDAMAVQKLHHQQMLTQPTKTDDDPPYSYVYSPITLPVLGALGHMPLPLLLVLYWALYAGGVIATLYVGFSLGEPGERRVLLYCAGVAAFLPGLLANGVLLSGNIAYILYAAVLLAALAGWKRNRWLPFYVAVILASCVKAPFLSFALVPPLSARKQWWPAAGAFAAGLALFGLQPLVWPSLFQHYLQAVELQFSYNHDFGCSPAGLFSQVLDAHGIPYAPWCYFFYVAYAIPLFAGLVYFSRRFLRGDFALAQWAPVLLVGILLLNPRIMEYDVAPITIPLALLAWRFARTRQHPGRWIAAMLVLFAVLNAGAIYSWELRKELDGVLLVAILLTGLWCLLRIVRRARRTALTAETQYADSAYRNAEHVLTFAAPTRLGRSA